MKTTEFLLAALLLSTGLLMAQQEKKPMTVRIKTIERVNGVERIKDTSFTTTEHSKLMVMPKPERIETYEIPLQGFNFSFEKDSLGRAESILIRQFTDHELQGEEHLSIWEEKVGPSEGKSEKNLEQMVLIETDDDDQIEINGKTGPVKMQKVIIIRKINVAEPTKEELKALGHTESKGSRTLSLKELSVAPNPSNGITGIRLEIATKGPTDICLYNNTGQELFHENLGVFSGTYLKELDLSNEPKGIYFLKVTQNQESITKKLIID